MTFFYVFFGLATLPIIDQFPPKGRMKPHCTWFQGPGIKLEGVLQLQFPFFGALQCIA